MVTGLQPPRDATLVQTASSLAVREPVHTRSLDAWRPFARELNPLLKALGEPLEGDGSDSGRSWGSRV